MNGIIELLTTILKAWKSGERWVKAVIIFGIIFVILGIIAYVGGTLLYVPERIVDLASGTMGVLGGICALVAIAYQNASDNFQTEERIQEAQRRVAENPLETQAAWDLARTKLEKYLDRNLAQVRSIFWLTILVMGLGFSLIGYGVFHIFESSDNLAPSVVVSASGILVNFLAGTFLLIYKSTMEQAKDYVTILERINAVGMSVQVLETIEDSETKLKDETTAIIAKQLLSMYSTASPPNIQQGSNGNG